MRGALVPVFLTGFVALAACEKRSEPSPQPIESAVQVPGPAPSPVSTSIPAFDAAQLNLFAPIPEGVEKPVLDDVAKLGQTLFFDKRLSEGGDVSCASCHDLAHAGADGVPKSIGTKKQQGKRNTPTILNAGGAFAQGWDGKVASMEDFIVAHARDPTIMGTKVAALEATHGAAFKRAFPEEKLSPETFGRALGAYAKKLFARARWDKYLGGDKSAVTDKELEGFAMFVEAGCTSCHQGKYVGATQAQRLGIAKPWPTPTEQAMYKVPTLRNVTKTAPYLHDGSVATLDEIVRLMARHQAGRELSDPQVKAIVTFLGTIEGEPPKELQKSK